MTVRETTTPSLADLAIALIQLASKAVATIGSSLPGEVA
jgi:hypothetical protein